MTRWVRDYFGSMTGRIFLVMLSGFLIAGTAALMFANVNREASLERLHSQRAAARVDDYYRLLRDRASPEKLASIPGIRRLSALPDLERINHGLTRALQERRPDLDDVRAADAALDICFPSFQPGLTRAPRRREWHMRAPTCWVVAIGAPEPVILAVETPMTVVNEAPLFDPRFLAVLALGALLVSLVVARVATAPLARLRQAALGLGEDVDQSPVDENGPLEVREAAAAFNRMQARLRTHIEERATMLAAISHDLQTPMTRMRLRLETLDAASRQPLLRDWYAMRNLVDEGLSLARAAHVRESPALVDLDSLIDTVVSDAVDAGMTASYPMRSGISVMLAPESIGRALANLVNNAAVHGGGAEVRVRSGGDTVAIDVMDRGPGIAEADIDAMMQPFNRAGEGGTGLGLSIARLLAERNGVRLGLAGRDGGGLIAALTIDRRTD